ncbi:hypothetical protein Rsub_12613, partial [Raphidocelis subcapitata]
TMSTWPPQRQRPSAASLWTSAASCVAQRCRWCLLGASPTTSCARPLAWGRTAAWTSTRSTLRPSALTCEARGRPHRAGPALRRGPRGERRGGRFVESAGPIERPAPPHAPVAARGFRRAPGPLATPTPLTRPL